MSETHSDPLSQELKPIHLLEELLSKEDQKQIEDRVGPVLNTPRLIPMSDLKSPPEVNDPNELIKNRFFCKGGIMLLVAHTGIGKSSFSRQLALYLAAGKPLFGIVPGDCYREEGRCES